MLFQCYVVDECSEVVYQIFSNVSWFISEFLEYVPLLCYGFEYACFLILLVKSICVYNGNAIIFYSPDRYIEQAPHWFFVLPWIFNSGCGFSNCYGYCASRYVYCVPWCRCFRKCNFYFEPKLLEYLCRLIFSSGVFPNRICFG